jgi:hypothetical protein
LDNLSIANARPPDLPPWGDFNQCWRRVSVVKGKRAKSLLSGMDGGSGARHGRGKIIVIKGIIFWFTLMVGYSKCGNRPSLSSIVRERAYYCWEQHYEKRDFF